MKLKRKASRLFTRRLPLRRHLCSEKSFEKHHRKQPSFPDLSITRIPVPVVPTEPEILDRHGVPTVGAHSKAPRISSSALTQLPSLSLRSFIRFGSKNARKMATVHFHVWWFPMVSCCVFQTNGRRRTSPPNPASFLEVVAWQEDGVDMHLGNGIIRDPCVKG